MIIARGRDLATILTKGASPNYLGNDNAILALGEEGGGGGGGFVTFSDVHVLSKKMASGLPQPSISRTL